MDAEKRRNLQYWKQRHAQVSVNPDTPQFLERFENADASRKILLEAQRLQFLPSKAVLKAQSKRKRKQKKGAKKNLRGEVAEIKRKQKVFEVGQRRYKEEQEPRVWGTGPGIDWANIVAGFAGAAGGGGFHFDPAVEQQRLRLKDRERQDNFHIAQDRLRIEGRQLDLNAHIADRDRIELNRRFDIEHAHLRNVDVANVRLRNRQIDNEETRIDNDWHALKRDRQLRREDQDELRRLDRVQQRLNDERDQRREDEQQRQFDVLAGHEERRVRLEEARDPREQRLRVEDPDRARRDEDIRREAERAGAQDAEIRRVARELDRISRRQDEPPPPRQPRSPERRGGGGLSRGDREFIAEQAGEVRDYVDRRMGDSERRQSGAIEDHLDRTGRSGDSDARRRLREGSEESEGFRTPQSSPQGGGGGFPVRPRTPTPEQPLIEEVEPIEEGYTGGETDTEEEDEPEGFERMGVEEAVRIARSPTTPRRVQIEEVDTEEDEPAPEEEPPQPAPQPEPQPAEPEAEPRDPLQESGELVEGGGLSAPQGQRVGFGGLRPAARPFTPGEQHGGGIQVPIEGGLEPAYGLGLGEGEDRPAQQLPDVPRGGGQGLTERDIGVLQQAAERRRAQGVGQEPEQPDWARGEVSEELELHGIDDAPTEQREGKPGKTAEQELTEHRLYLRKKYKYGDPNVWKKYQGREEGQRQDLAAKYPQDFRKLEELEKAVGSPAAALSPPQTPRTAGGERIHHIPGERARPTPAYDRPPDPVGGQESFTTRGYVPATTAPAGGVVEGVQEPLGRPTEAERREGERLYDTLEAQLQVGGRGRRAGQTADVGALTGTGYVIVNRGTREYKGINPGGRVNVVGREAGNTYRLNTGKGGRAVSRIQGHQLRAAIQKGDLSIEKGEAPRRPRGSE